MNRFAITIATITAGLLLWATPAVAHTPSVTPSCTGLAVVLTQYEGGFNNNTITTTIDGTATTTGFGGSYSHTFPWSQTVNHSWSVVIDANLVTGNPTAYDASFSGSWEPCQVPPTTTTTVPPPTTVPANTTTVPATTVPEGPQRPPGTVPAGTPITNETTTTAVAVAEPVVPVTTQPVPPTTIAFTNDTVDARSLPATGNDWLTPFAIIAAVLVTIGACLHRGAR